MFCKKIEKPFSTRRGNTRGWFTRAITLSSPRTNLWNHPRTIPHLICHAVPRWNHSSVNRLEVDFCRIKYWQQISASSKMIGFSFHAQSILVFCFVASLAALEKARSSSRRRYPFHANGNNPMARLWIHLTRRSRSLVSDHQRAKWSKLFKGFRKNADQIADY